MLLEQPWKGFRRWSFSLQGWRSFICYSYCWCKQNICNLWFKFSFMNSFRSIYICCVTKHKKKWSLFNYKFSFYLFSILEYELWIFWFSFQDVLIYTADDRNVHSVDEVSFVYIFQFFQLLWNLFQKNVYNGELCSPELESALVWCIPFINYVQLLREDWEFVYICHAKETTFLQLFPWCGDIKPSTKLHCLKFS